MVEKNVIVDKTTGGSGLPDAPQELSPLQKDALNFQTAKTGIPSETAGISAREMNHLQFQALENTYRPTPITGTHMPFKGDGTNVSVVDSHYKAFISATEDGKAEHLSEHAEPVHIRAKDGSGVGLEYDAAKRGVDGRPLVTTARVYPTDGADFTLKRLGQTDKWLDSRTGEFSNFQVERALGADPRKTAEIMIKDAANPEGNLFFAPHGTVPKLLEKLSPEQLQATAKTDAMLASRYSQLAGANSWDLMRLDLGKHGDIYSGLNKLTMLDNESLLQKGEDIGRFVLKEHGSKVGLAIAAAASLAIAGKYLFGSNEKPAPASEIKPASEPSPFKSGKLDLQKFLAPAGETNLEEFRKFGDPYKKRLLEEFPSKAATDFDGNVNPYNLGKR